MSKERELLERALWWLIALRDIDKVELAGLDEEIRDYLANANPSEAEPVAWMFFSTKGRPHYHLNEYQALEGLQMYGGDKVIALYEHLAPRKEFVRLSDEEVNSLTYAPYEPYELICAVENRLVEKNNG